MISRVSLWTAAAVIMWLAASTTELASEPRAPSPDARWREPLERAETALAGGDARGAERAWEEAYRAVVRPGTPGGMLEVGLAYLRIGEAARDRQTAVARARHIFLVALFQARERRDPDVVAAVGEAFASLGDREVADRAFAVAMALAAQNSDARTCERIAVLRQRLTPPASGTTAAR